MSRYARLSAAMATPGLHPAGALVGADIAAALPDFDPAFQEALVSWYEAAVVPGAVPGPPPERPPPEIPGGVPEIHHWRIEFADGYVAFVRHMGTEGRCSRDWEWRKLDAAESRVLGGLGDEPAVWRAVARHPQVVKLTRRVRTLGAEIWGLPHRGMIPGGEDEAAYNAALARGELDPDPVWSDTPASVGDDWG